MELKYKVSQDDYGRYLQAGRKKKMRKPINIFFTVVVAIMPLAVFGYGAWLQIVTGWKLALFGVAAAALAIGNLVVRMRYWRGAGAALGVMKKNGEISDDFWKEHKLHITEGGVKLISGGYSQEYGWVNFGGFDECEGLLLPIFSAAPADLIPMSALDAVGGVERFKRDFTDMAKIGVREAFAEERAAPPAAARHTLSYEYTKEDYLRDQRDAQRRRYTTKLILNRAAFAKLFLTAVMVYAIYISTSAWLNVVYIFIMLLLNYEHISTFTPLVTRRMAKSLRPILALQPGRRATLYATDEGVKVVGDIHYLDLPFREIVAARRTPHALALYLVSQTVLTVPAPPTTEAAAFDGFCAYVTEEVARRRKD